MKHAVIKSFAAMFLSAFGVSESRSGEFSRAWQSPNSSIVLDAYEYTPLDWSKIRKNKRLAGFINKASDGLTPTFRCGRNALCRVKWKRYSTARELYHTRKVLAKTLGLKWGAYHLARPGNPIKQAEHFLEFAKPDKDDLIALDIEHNDPKKWMSLADSEIFARHIKMRTGRYPVLYTNHSTSKFIAANRDKYKLLSRLNLWYARYKPSMRGAFPMGNWKSYTIWQFSSMVNCNDRSCPWRINGAGNWIDVNVVNMPPAQLRKQWPFAKLRAKSAPAEQDGPGLMAVAAESVVALAMLPKWRPGTVFEKRKSFRTSDQIRVALAKHIRPFGASYRTSDQVRIELAQQIGPLNNSYRTSDQIRLEVAKYLKPLNKSLNLLVPSFPVEQIVIEAKNEPQPWQIPGAI